MAHTPTPWKVVGQHYEGPNGQTVQTEPYWVNGDPGDDASYIVRAVNCHKELLEALKELVKALSCHEAGVPTQAEADAYMIARAAIAKAEGREP